MGYIKALRLKTSGSAGLITYAAFHLANLGTEKLAYITAVFVMIGAMATMVLNDLIDHEHDVKKGKRFAHDNYHNFLYFTATIWLITYGMGLILLVLEEKFTVIVIVMIFLGLVYSYTRTVPLLSALTVATASSLSVTFAQLINPDAKVGYLIYIVFFFTLGREILKDLEDTHDIGYKLTLPVVAGVAMSRWIFTIEMILSVVLIMWVALPLGIFELFIAVSAIIVVYHSDHVKQATYAKNIVDAGMLILIFYLLFLM